MGENHRATKNLDYGNDPWLPFARVMTAVGVFFVLGVFILMVILYSTIVNAPTYVCEGTFLVLDTGTSFAIIMTYRSIFSAVELVLGIVLLKIGTELVLIFRKFSKKITVPLGKQIKIGLAVYAGAFGLFAQAIYYLVITATRNPYQSIYLSLSILLVDEIIPALCFLSCLITLPAMSKLSSFGTFGSSGSGKSTPSSGAGSKASGGGVSGGGVSGGASVS